MFLVFYGIIILYNLTGKVMNNNNDYIDFMILFLKLKTSNLENEEYQLNDFDYGLIDKFFDIKDENGFFIKSKDIEKMVNEDKFFKFEMKSKGIAREILLKTTGKDGILHDDFHNLKDLVEVKDEKKHKVLLGRAPDFKFHLKSSLQDLIPPFTIDFHDALKNKIDYIELYNKAFEVFEEIVLSDNREQLIDIIILALINCKKFEDCEKLSKTILETDNIAKRAVALRFLNKSQGLKNKPKSIFLFKCILYRDVLKILGDQEDFMAITFFLGPYYKSRNLLTGFLESMENRLKEVEEITGTPMNKPDDYFELTDDQLLLLEMSNFEVE